MARGSFGMTQLGAGRLVGVRGVGTTDPVVVVVDDVVIVDAGGMDGPDGANMSDPNGVTPAA